MERESGNTGKIHKQKFLESKFFTEVWRKVTLINNDVEAGKVWRDIKKSPVDLEEIERD